MWSWKDFCQGENPILIEIARFHCPITRDTVGAAFCRPQLTEIGHIVENEISVLSNTYPDVWVDKYVIMPNHVHMIVFLNTAGDGSVMERGRTVGDGTPTLQSVVGRIKSYTAKRWSDMCNTKHQTLWQRSFHDRIIRNEAEYQHIWQYIDENPARWTDDKYYENTKQALRK